MVADARDTLSPRAVFALSVLVTGATGFALEYLGTEVFHAFANANPATLFIATAIWAFLVGPLLAVTRRSSILLPMAVVGGVFFVLVLVNHYRTMLWIFVPGTGYAPAGLSAPRVWEFTGGRLFGLDHPLLIALAAGIVETVVVPISVGIQRLLLLGRRRPPAVSPAEVEETFRASVDARDTLRAPRDFGYHFLRFIFFAYGIYFVYMIVGLLAGGRDLPVVSMFFFNPPETVNSVMKLTLMISLANVGAHNVHIRREAATLLFIGHAVSVGASLGLYFGTAVNPVFPAEQGFLLSSVVGDGALLVGLLYVMVKPGAERAPLTGIEDVELRSPASSVMRAYFLVFAVLFSAFTVAIAAFRIAGNPEAGLGAVFGGPDPLVSNSLTKYGALAAIGWFLFARPRLRRFFVPTLALAFSFSLAATVLYGLRGTTVLVSRLGTDVALPSFMVQHVLVDGGGLALLLAIRRWQYRVDFQIAALGPDSAECVMLLHRAFREEAQEPASSASVVLHRIDEQVATMRGRRRGLVAVPFWIVERIVPLLCGLGPAFSTMSRAEARWMLRRGVLRPSYERAKAFSPGVADFLAQIGDVAHGLVTLAYFSSEPGQRRVGYVPPDARKRLQSEVPDDRPPDGAEALPYPENAGDATGRKPVADPAVAARLLAPRIGSFGASATVPDAVDYCIVGSGAAGAVLAYRLAAATNGAASICVLERGGYYNPREDFSDDEMRMIRMLYADGGLQTTRSFDFSILQGECVGGTTVINNAVCFRMPELSRDEWRRFGIDPASFDAQYDRVAREIDIDVVHPRSVNARVEALFTKGVEGFNALPEAERVSPVARNSGNFNACVGCGLCNIGCRRQRKLSMLETYLPWAQRLGVRVCANVGAVQCETAAGPGGRRATAVVVRTGHGAYRRVGVRKGLIVAAGAVASSRFLLRSGLGGAGVGRGLACNFALPPVVEFPETVNAFDGLQMALYAIPDSFDAIFETTFNPPGAHALSVPTYFSRHARVMEAYARSANFTALVGSDPAGSVSRTRDVLFGRAVEWTPTPDDLLRIRKALGMIARMAKAAGGTRILLPTHPVLDLPLDGTLDASLDRFHRVLTDRSFFNFITAHPQGGNMMAADTFDARVVETDFRVRGCANVYVCDASVFPRGIRVNPQWTIMALASTAGERIAAG